MLYDRWVLDVPKLLDLAAIYGPDNATLMQQLMQQVLAVTNTLPAALQPHRYLTLTVFRSLHRRFWCNLSMGEISGTLGLPCQPTCRMYKSAANRLQHN